MSSYQYRPLVCILNTQSLEKKNKYVHLRWVQIVNMFYHQLRRKILSLKPRLK